MSRPVNPNNVYPDFGDEPTDPRDGYRDDCDNCGAKLIAMFTSRVCPNACDRIAEGRCPKCGSKDHEVAPKRGWFDPPSKLCRGCGHRWIA